MSIRGGFQIHSPQRVVVLKKQGDAVKVAEYGSPKNEYGGMYAIDNFLTNNDPAG